MEYSFNDCYASSGNTSIKDPNILPKLSEVLDLISKKTKRGAKFQDAYMFNITTQVKKFSFHGKNLVKIINDCLLNHRFNEATKLLWLMCQDRCSFDLILYKGIMIVLDNLIPDVELETIKNITRNIRNLRVINKLELQLEYLIYALQKDINGTEDSYYLENKILRRRPIKKIPLIELFYSAYSALISYLTWANISQSERFEPTNMELSFTIIQSFKQIVIKPGIWDVFILKLVEMLEFYEEYNELEKILKKYVESNPHHLNAYIYLCMHLHKHGGDTEMFIQYAKILSNLCPSDERVLLLVQKWDELGKNLKKCLKILFAFLDYPVNGRRLLGWQLLSEHLDKAILRNESSLKEYIDSSWEKRSASWTYMHFRLSNVDTDAFELVQWKVRVLSVMESNHEYIKYIKEKFPNSREHLLQNRDSSTSENF